MDDVPDQLVSSEKPTDKEEEARAKAFERMYKESHPSGPYPPVELKPKQESQSLSKEERKQAKQELHSRGCRIRWDSHLDKETWIKLAMFTSLAYLLSTRRNAAFRC